MPDTSQGFFQLKTWQLLIDHEKHLLAASLGQARTPGQMEDERQQVAMVFPPQIGKDRDLAGLDASGYGVCWKNYVAWVFLLNRSSGSAE